MAPAAKSIKVNLAQQIVEAYEGSTRVFRFDCVTGDSEHPTDRGFFQVMRKVHPYRDPACNEQMDYALFFTHDGKALHQYHGPVPLSVVRNSHGSVGDWFGSHGCVRLSEVHAKTLYEWASVGTTVQVE